ncbi:hypothetical protein ACJMK2_024276 [Sinanodonta woodiana]|uniref:Calcitonin gene-related peptide type 1 receptor n=1 Tax=Sinanodonta woodiana TaxID=1069815 RepID=A0ABD3T8Q5_SINWO
MCYFFLFPSKSLKPFYSSGGFYLTVPMNVSSNVLLVPDIDNETQSHDICITLSADECHRWRLCCQSARDCCRRHLSMPEPENGTCKRTWDGFGCWDDARPGSENYLSCPGFLQYSIPTRSAVKSCLANGTWMTKGGSKWTDYTPCLDIDELKTTIFLKLGCNVLSLSFLVPSLGIFCYYKSLRKQHRIRLHINFFLSFTFSGIFYIIWDMLVTYDKLTNPMVTDTLLYENHAGCKLLSFLKIYFTSTNYMWMFCESFYLHRLITNAFSPPKTLIVLYCAGWGVPLVSIITYAILRGILANESCWSKSMEEEEWIIYAPNLTCLVANLFFLCNILRILLTQLQVHPNEPSNFRRALKATFVLIPLFGVQLFVTIYRVPPSFPGALHYERFSEFVICSQGFSVALIFCFCNSECILKTRMY